VLPADSGINPAVNQRQNFLDRRVVESAQLIFGSEAFELLLDTLTVGAVIDAGDDTP
jgi:hypothetical protein